MNLRTALGAALDRWYPLGPHSMGREPKTPVTEQRGLKARMDRIMHKFGGNRREAAKAAGVPYSTWNHLLAGRRVSTKNLEKITGAFGRLVTAPARALVVKKRGETPSVWNITAVVVVDPGDPRFVNKGGGGRGARYINGQPTGTTREEAAALGPGDPGFRTFKAEGLDGETIVNAWITGGDEKAEQALLDEVADAYGEEIGFEGDDVRVVPE